MKTCYDQIWQLQFQQYDSQNCDEPESIFFGLICEKKTKYFKPVFNFFKEIYKEIVYIL